MGFLFTLLLSNIILWCYEKHQSNLNTKAPDLVFNEYLRDLNRS